MKRLLDKACIDLEPSPTHSATANSASTPTLGVAAPSHYSRLKLDLPKYSGDVLDWKEFWSIFSARISTETNSLSEHERKKLLGRRHVRQ